MVVEGVRCVLLPVQRSVGEYSMVSFILFSYYLVDLLLAVESDQI